MKQLRKFLSLTASDRLLLIKATIILVLIRLGLKLLLFHKLRSLLAKIAQSSTKLKEADEASVNKVVWAVTVASPYIRATCLPKALTTQLLLNRCGYSTQLHIGFARGKGGQMHAHAWVENQGKIVIGSVDKMAHYIPVPLPEIESDASGDWRLLS